jgi:hypothetical protein
MENTRLMDSAEKIKELEAKVAMYEHNGPAKLYFSLNRKMNEMADLLNKSNLAKLDLDNKESKEFDRLFKLLEKSQVISNAAQSVKDFAGLTGDEFADISRKPFKGYSPESVADEIGELAGKKN